MRHCGIRALRTGVALFALSALPGARADTGAKPVEEVDFATSCKSEVQAASRHAAWTLHSFWYLESVKEFDAVAKAEAIGGKTEREKAYIAAIAVFYKDSGTLDHQTCAVAYEKAMADLHQRYPDDRVAAIFYALSLDATALPSDKTYANQKQAAAILEPLFVAEPNHPGIAHYRIHSYDEPPLAAKGLPAARRYAQIAPSVPHALHMPRHIFTRLGYWQESIESNRRSARDLLMRAKTRVNSRK